jgi:ankyrin repeat protein
LHLAACEGHGDIVDYLLMANANPNARDRFGGTALHDSIRHHQTAAINAKLKEAGCQLVGMVSARM